MCDDDDFMLEDQEEVSLTYKEGSFRCLQITDSYKIRIMTLTTKTMTMKKSLMLI